MYVSQERLKQLSIAVLLMYVMIFSNGVKSIVGCNIRHALTNNFMIQHLMAFLILLFFIVVTTKETNQGGFGKNVVFSVIVYIWFAMLTRIRIEMFLLVLVLLLVAYALGKMEAEEPTGEHERLKHNTTNQMEIYQVVLAVFAVFITVASFMHYTYSKMTQHGNAFSWERFFTKAPKCSQCKMKGKCV
jgi:hypothetical protein